MTTTIYMIIFTALFIIIAINAIKKVTNAHRKDRQDLIKFYRQQLETIEKELTIYKKSNLNLDKENIKLRAEKQRFKNELMAAEAFGTLTINDEKLKRQLRNAE